MRYVVLNDRGEVHSEHSALAGARREFDRMIARRERPMAIIESHQRAEADDDYAERGEAL